jgi:hypothetical protein
VGQVTGPEPAPAAGRAERASPANRTEAGTATATPVAALPVAPSRPAGRAQLVALQRVAGNAAVAQLLAAGTPVHVQRQPTRAELLEAYEQDVAAGRWAQAAERLNGFNDADIRGRAAALSADQRASMRAACPEWNHRVRRALLDVDYLAALKANTWPVAANLLNAFSDPDIKTRVGALTRPQRIDLYVAAPPRIAGIVLTSDREAAYQGDIRKADWAAAAIHLAGFNDAEIDTRAKAMTAAQRASIRGACAPDNHRVRRPLLDLDFKAAVTANDWAGAANLLNAFNDPDITTRVGALKGPQRINLYVAANVRIGDIVAVVDRESAYQGDLRKPDWVRAAVHLAGFGDAEIATRVKALTSAQRTSMIAACAAGNHRVRRALLDVEFKAAVAAGDWAGAANLLNAFNDPDITTRVRALTPAQRIDLYVPAPNRIADIIAVVDLDSAFQGAIRRPDWARAATHLNGFPDAGLAAKVAALTAGQRAAMLAACPAGLTRVRIVLIGRPVAGSLIPFDRAPQAAAGERIIFNETYTHPTPGQFQLVYTGAGGGFGGGRTATQTVPGLRSGNLDFHISPTWTGTTATTVQMQLQLLDGTVFSTENWVFGFKGTTPTTMTQLETENERPLGSVYTYQLGPDIGPPGRPDYEHQTILETFGGRTCNVTLAELQPGYAAANAIVTQADLTRHFFGNASNNGTFTVDRKDRVYDVHTGMPPLARFVAALITMKEVHVDLPQTYEVVPGVPLARFNVRRIMKPDGSAWLRKTRVP